MWVKKNVMWPSGLDLRLYRREKDEGFTRVARDCREIFTQLIFQDNGNYRTRVAFFNMLNHHLFLTFVASEF